MAKRLGADHIINVDKEDVVAKVREYTGGALCDIAFDCSGNPEALEQSTEFVKKGATIVTPGLYGGKKTPIDFDTVVFGELHIKGAHTHHMGSVKKAIDIINSKKYPLEDLVTHKYTLDEAEHAVRVTGGWVEGEFPIKVVIEPNK